MNGSAWTGFVTNIVGTDLRTITQIYEHKVTKKGQLVFSDATHPLCNEFQLLLSGRRFNSLCANQTDTRIHLLQLCF